jgi:hypothetical protein
MKYVYFYHDNAFFRRVADTIRASVDDVWFPNQGDHGAWVPYMGDRQKPYSFGNKIAVDQLPKDARAASEEPTDHPNLINLTKQSEGKAFQILSAPGTKPPKPR